MDDITLLDLERLRATLAHEAVGHTIDYHASLRSAMLPARALAGEPTTPSGVVVTTEEQRQGRGRLGRTWEAPFARALLMTAILKTPHLPAQPARLAMIAGIAVVDALEIAAPELAGRVWLKWPNDVLIIEHQPDTEAQSKVAGVLIESSFQGGIMQYGLLGIGVNVNQLTAELPETPPGAPPAASLFTALGRKVDRTSLLIELCRTLGRYVAGPAAAFVEQRWRERLHTLGRPVTVTRELGRTVERIRGVAIDVTPAGELIVEDEAGARHRFAAGDVTLRA
jgi:BirA family biotin operon repressor/biotin-[acetyl-CoA-carboxylase] ligase